MQVTAAVLEEHHKPLNVQELEIDEPLAGEVLVKIVASGSSVSYTHLTLPTN